MKPPEEWNSERAPKWKPPQTRFEQGLVQVYTGDGKGKSTAAFGLALRATGRGLKVKIVQLLKGDTSYGEIIAIRSFPTVDIVQFGSPEFVNPLHPREEDRQMARDAYDHARQALLSGQFDVVIIDEINVAAKLGLISVDDILNLIKEKPKQVELVLTGRDADPRVIEAADLVTQMTLIKHPYEKGISARFGIEY
ncbi:MAG: cob(I)yrinic acid a,c-diamide adenosyltransferase [Dehalococcoidia bacterium]|nr:cob(I)yrinic acid a,c-diamide adenosyltransferase [Dehalococcoidia bacterium]